MTTLPPFHCHATRPELIPPPMTDSPSSESARLDELEMRVVHQDQTIEDLNAAITAQWKLIERLERQVARLAERVADSERSPGDAAPVDRPPPHY
jgi:SlyX protein